MSVALSVDQPTCTIKISRERLLMACEPDLPSTLYKAMAESAE